MPIHTINDAIGAAHREVVDGIRSAVRLVLEEKHLYQSASVDVAGAFTKHLKPHAQSPAGQAWLAPLSAAPRWLWRLKDDDDVLTNLANIAGAASNPRPEEFLWQAPDIKVYCATCDRREPFNVFSSQNVLPRTGAAKASWHTPKGVVQVFCISYLCQSCKSIPETFLLRRLGGRVQLTGRSPMEAVEVPKYVPPQVSKYFSGAQVAFQSGQTLAALFMLRTLCEQWVRGFSGAEDKADVCLESYSATLPADFRDRFPSLKATYGELSAAIHEAHEDEALYMRSADAICEHFEARKVYKLPMPSTPPR